MGFGRGYSQWVFGGRHGCDHEGLRAMRGGGRFGEAFGFGGFGHHGHGDRGFRGRGGRRRLFDGEELQSLLLALIAETPRHGYDLIREIESRSGGVYAPSPGVVYPTLTLLDEMGQIEELKEEGARRRFAVTEAGRATLAEKQAAVDALLARLAELDADNARTDRAPIRRAMMGLAMAVRERMSSDGGEQAHAIAAILDEATRKIEQID
jgi:DNA-binding PadR family transcriptional regulator